ncbi:hypothetical protein [Pedobacter sp. L105]|uniref:hypothetical protein n=1 Tax=Pedobacter sp. L105 TaxID=1641871 RepID=UPI00131CD799|nr:hypothetical protein [Pedobacter sp. L105]
MELNTIDFGSQITAPKLSAASASVPAIVIFVNGYRMSVPVMNIVREIRRNEDVTIYYDNEYWNDIDDKFQQRLGDQFAFYADGDAPTITAKNEIGFHARKRHGRKAGYNLIVKINQIKYSDVRNETSRKILWGQDADLNRYDPKKIPIDIVCHSMGFAYALGMVEVLKELGYNPERIYALAPENPGGGSIPGFIKESIQYGSGPVDHWYKQDMIAPQKAIPGIGQVQFIPPGVPKGPYASHSVANYGWIFGLKKGIKSYVKSRISN